MPLVHWLRDELSTDVLDVLLDRRSLERGYFAPKVLRRLLNDHLSGRRDRSGQIWQLLCLELWHRNFLETHGPNQSSASPAAIVS